MGVEREEDHMSAKRGRSGPFIIRECVAHDSSPQFGSLNHGGLAKRNASGPAPFRRLRAGADIDLPTIADETVENDPGCVKTPCLL